MCITFTSRFIVNIKLYIMKFEDCKVVFFSLVSRVDSAIEKSHSQIYVSPLGSIVVSIPACHAGDRSSIPRLGEFFTFFY